jgi:hypothetical protein
MAPDFPGVVGPEIGWPVRPVRADGSQSDKKLRHAARIIEEVLA